MAFTPPWQSVEPSGSVLAAAEDDLVDYAGAATITGIGIPTLRAMVCRGTIPFFRLAPRTVRFSPRQLRAWAASTAMQPPPTRKRKGETSEAA